MISIVLLCIKHAPHNTAPVSGDIPLPMQQTRRSTQDDASQRLLRNGKSAENSDNSGKQKMITDDGCECLIFWMKKDKPDHLYPRGVDKEFMNRCWRIHGSGCQIAMLLCFRETSCAMERKTEISGALDRMVNSFPQRKSRSRFTQNKVTWGGMLRQRRMHNWHSFFFYTAWCRERLPLRRRLLNNRQMGDWSFWSFITHTNKLPGCSDPAERNPHAVIPREAQLHGFCHVDQTATSSVIPMGKNMNE